MKKLFPLLLIFMLLLGLIGCEKAPVKDNTPSSSEAPLVDNSVSAPSTSPATEILKPDVTLSDAKLAATAAKNLGVPNDPTITYEIGEMFYWEVGETYLKNIYFYKNDETVACAGVDPRNGELIRNIYKYDNNAKTFYNFFKDPYFAEQVAEAMGKNPANTITQEELANFTGKIEVFLFPKSLDGIGYLKSITELSVAKCPVEEIPSEISNCKKLKRLDLLKAYDLKKLPESIGELTELEYLNLMLTQVDKLPVSIGNLTKLKYLYASSIPLTSLPENIGFCENLVVLDLHSTKITKIPDSVTGLKKLKSLDLGYTKITALPENIGELKELVRLDLFGLDLKRLPQSTKNLTKLEFLNVYNNYNLNEEYKSWFKKEVYQCKTDPESSKNWDDGK